MHALSCRPPIWSRDFAYSGEGSVVLSECSPDFMAVPKTNDACVAEYARNQCPDIMNSMSAGRTVDICVGPEHRRWSLHRELLCHHSPYFRNEFAKAEGSQDKEISSDHPIALPDEDPNAFELFVRWLYRDPLEDLSCMQTDEEKYNYAVTCQKLYMLCDKLGIIELKNLAMDRYRQALFEAQLVPDAGEIKDLYFTTPRGSALRKLLIKIAARQIMDPVVLRSAEDYRECFEEDAGFAVAVIDEIRSMSGGILFDDPTDGDNALWHDDCTREDQANDDEGVEKARATIRSRTAGRISNERIAK